MAVECNHLDGHIPDLRMMPSMTTTSGIDGSAFVVSLNAASPVGVAVGGRLGDFLVIIDIGK
jgi:hypothetical protein